MTKNNKLYKKKELAENFTSLHLKGQKGPSKTIAVHGKKLENRWFNDRGDWYRRNEKGYKSKWKGK